ncbi:MAG: bacteriohemerythrin [Treponema sp.]|nr:bacteriohemerythrin [Treponema sp.]
MAQSNVFIPWEDRFAVGIPLVDNQHKELLNLANALHDTCRQGKEFVPEGFKKTAGAAVEYVKVHFSTEEKIMERVNYPGMAEHKAEHQKFVRKVLEEVRNFEDGVSFVPNRFVAFLKDWILSHIALMDKKMADYVLDLAKRGLLKQ